MNFASIFPSVQDLSPGDAVATWEDMGRAEKLDNYRSKFDALSPKRVHQKLRNLLEFYSVKATTLVQVMYPLILKGEGTAQSNDVPMGI
ncbi:hypothetical protein ACHAWF_000606 [Thalassiosira exigua]